MSINIEQQKLNQINAVGSGVAEPVAQGEYEIITVPGFGFGYTEIKEIGKVWFPWQSVETISKKKIWGLGLFEGLKVDEVDIENAKKSLFPDRF